MFIAIHQVRIFMPMKSDRFFTNVQSEDLLLYLSDMPYTHACSASYLLRVPSVPQDWEKLDDYPHVLEFLEAMKLRPSWNPSAPISDAAVADGWKLKTEKTKSF